jgi:hypothetical protein
MRRKWLGIMLSLGLLTFASCKTGADKYRPPQPPEQYVVPPADDARFSQPIHFPKDKLNQDNRDKDDDEKAPPIRSPGRMGAGNPGGY